MKNKEVSKEPLGEWQYNELEDRLLLEFNGLEFSIARENMDVKEIQTILIERMLQKIDINNEEGIKQLEKLYIINTLLYSLYDDSKAVEVINMKQGEFVNAIRKAEEVEDEGPEDETDEKLDKLLSEILNNMEKGTVH